MEFYLMRHGQTDWNIDKRMQGQSDIPLNETGRRQAREAAAKLTDLQFDRVLASPLKRAVETAEIVTEGRGMTVEPEPLAIEMDFGTLEGLPASAHPMLKTFFRSPQDYVPQEGETYQAVEERCRALLRKLRNMEGGQERVLLVAHGAILRAIQCVVEEIPLRDFWKDLPQPNCSVTVLELTDGVYHIREVGRALLEENSI